MQGFSHLWVIFLQWNSTPAPTLEPHRLVILFSSRAPIPNSHSHFWKKTTSSLDQARWPACVSPQERYNKVESASCKVITKTGSPTEVWYNSQSPGATALQLLMSPVWIFSSLHWRKDPSLWESLLGSVEIMQAKAFCKLWNTPPV